MDNKPTIIYIITNTINEKRYIGITSFNITKRWNEHINRASYGVDTRLYRAIRKYGRTSFTMEILIECSSRKEAFDLEIVLISLIRPEYNIARGGAGGRGPITEKGRIALSRFHKGNKYRLGTKQSIETRGKVRMAQFNPSIMINWAERRKFGPIASARPVICLTDQKRFPSASAAALHYKLAKSAIIELCGGKRGRKTVGGMVFKYEDNHASSW